MNGSLLQGCHCVVLMILYVSSSVILLKSISYVVVVTYCFVVLVFRLLHVVPNSNTYLLLHDCNMGAPRFEPAAVPILADGQLDLYALTLDSETVDVGAVSMGNPHAVLRVDDIDTAEVERLGPLIEGNALFPQRTNAGFMQVVSPKEIRLRVFERGVGETLACGSGACAAVAHGIARGWLHETVTVNLPGGKLWISWKGPGKPVMMTGPTANVFEGSIRL